MTSRVIEKLDGSWQSFSRLPIALRIPLFILFWPLLIGLYIFSKNRNTKVNIAALIALALFLQIPWFSSLADLGDLKLPTISSSSKESATSITAEKETTNPSLAADPVVKVSYGAISTSCTGYFMTGTLEVKNSGNVTISGRAEIPVSTYEKFMIPLSGVFLNLPQDSSTVISLEGGEGCKKGQVVGKPSAIFTVPSQDKLETLNQLDAFEWSGVKAVCDKASAFVRLKATVRNTSNYVLTAGIQAYLSNGPMSQGQIDAGVKGTSYFGTIYKLGPGESREIDFGYGDHCLKGRKGFDGPYTTEFETRFTY